LVALGWVRPWAWTETAALGLAISAFVALGAATATVRVPETVAARAADRGLGTGDVIATALEVDPAAEPFGPAVHERAGQVVRGREPGDAVPISPRWRRWLAALAL